LSLVDLSKYVPDFEISINGVVQPSIRNSTISVQINEELENIPKFTVIIADQFIQSKQEFFWLDNSLLNLGNEISIKMGYANHMQEMIKGQIKSLSTSGFSSEIPQLTVEGFDTSHTYLTEAATSGGNSVQIERNDTYSDIAQKIADKAGLTAVIDETEFYSPVIMGVYHTYIDFLKHASQMVGFEFFVSKHTLFYCDPRKPNQTPSMELVWNKNIIEFVPKINTSEIVTKVVVRGSSPTSRSPIIANAKAGEEDVLEQGKKTAGNLAVELYKDRPRELKDNIVLHNLKEGKAVAKAELNRIGDKLVEASGSIIGDPSLAPGHIIDFKNFGKTFSGKYYVTEVTQSIGGDGYKTSFKVRKNVI